MTTGTERSVSSLLPAPAALMPAPDLRFAADAAELRTDFRDYVLNLAYAVAGRELGDALQSAEVSAWHSPDEPAPPRLLLTIWADVGKDRWRRVNKVLIETLIDESTRWSSVEVEDYRSAIHIDVEPIDP